MSNVSNTGSESDARDIMEAPARQTDGAALGRSARQQLTISRSSDTTDLQASRPSARDGALLTRRRCRLIWMDSMTGAWRSAPCLIAHTWKLAGRDSARGEAFRGTTEWRRSSNRHAEQLQDIMASGPRRCTRRPLQRRVQEGAPAQSDCLFRVLPITFWRLTHISLRQIRLRRSLLTLAHDSKVSFSREPQQHGHGFLAVLFRAALSIGLP